MTHTIREARERAQDFLAANPTMQRVVVRFPGGRLIRDRADYEAIKTKEANDGES